jgi:transcriptional regulator with XRE-family HTH domain
MTDEKRRMVRAIRKKLKLKQTELAALAGISQQIAARFERGKHVSLTTEDRITGAIIRTTARRNSEQFMEKVVQPLLKAVEECEKIHSVEPGTQLALELEKLNGKSLAELKARSETMAGFLRRAGNNFLSLTK